MSAWPMNEKRKPSKVLTTVWPLIGRHAQYMRILIKHIVYRVKATCEELSKLGNLVTTQKNYVWTLDLFCLEFRF